MENTSGILPTGGHVLIFPDPVEEKTSGGIYLPDTTRDTEKRAATTGIVIAIGPGAWHDIDDGQPWAAVNNHVSYARYAGVEMKGKDEQSYVLINDNDILAVLQF
jgi:chaperonin GroES